MLVAGIVEWKYKCLKSNPSITYGVFVYTSVILEYEELN